MQGSDDARIPLAQEALELTSDGKVLLRLRRRWRDGTQAIRFEPSELLERSDRRPRRIWDLAYGAPLRDSEVRFRCSHVLWHMGFWVGRAAALSAAFVAFVAVPAAEGGVNVWSSHPPSNVAIEPGSVFALAIDPVTPDTLYAGTRCSGVFKSDNGGRWTALNNDDLSSACVEAVVLDPSAPGTLYVGTGDGTVFKTLDDGDTWSATGLPANLLVLAIDPTMPTTLYAGTYKGGVFRYSGGGEGWTSNGLIPEEISSLAIDPMTPTRLYAGSARGVFRSLDGGATWSDPDLTELAVRALIINPATPSTLYAATDDGVFRSADGGNSWSATGLDSGSTFAFAIDPITPTTLYASTTAGVAKSTDAGATWRDLSAGLPMTDTGPQNRVVKLLVDPQEPTRLYAGTTRRGVFSIQQVAECISDCNDNDRVTVDEILTAVAIALGRVAPSACIAGDQDSDGTVTVDEITVAVHNGLSGCPPRATPTPTVTVTPTPTSNCVTALTGQQYAPVLGGPGCVDVAAPAECCWEATTSGLSITSGSSACGDGSVCFEVPVWHCQFRRCQYEIAAGGKTFQIYQEGPGTPPATQSPTRTPTPTGPTPSSTETVPPTPTPTVTSTGTPAVGVFAYIVEAGRLAVRVIDTADNRDVLTLPIPSKGTVLLDIAVSADGRRAYVSNPHQVFVIDTTHNVLLGEFSLPHQTERIATSPSHDLLLASSRSADELDVIQTADGTVSAHIPVGDVHGDVVITSDGALAYVTTRPKTVSVIDLEGYSVVETIALDAPPVALAISADDSVLYVSTELETVGVQIVDTATRRVRGNVPLEHASGAIAITPDARLALCAHPTAGSVSIIDTQTESVLRTISVGDRPSDIGVTPDGTRAYVMNQRFFALQASISVIDTRSLEVAQTLPAGSADRVAMAQLR